MILKKYCLPLLLFVVFEAAMECVKSCPKMPCKNPIFARGQEEQDGAGKVQPLHFAGTVLP